MSLDWRDIRRALTDQGWTMAKTANGHVRAKSSNGTAMVHFAESSEPRALRNTIAELRDKGFVWPWPPTAPRQRIVARADVPGSLFEPEEGAPDVPNEVEAEAEVDRAPRPKTLEDLFAELRDARTYLDLAADEARRKEIAAEEARRAHETALAELARARDDLAAKKKAFDAAFDAPSTAA